MKNSNWKAVIAMATALTLSACGSEELGSEEPDTVFEWAINVGGPAYTGVDGVEYAAEEFVSGGETGSLDKVKGSQDEPLYLTVARTLRRRGPTTATVSSAA